MFQTQRSICKMHILWKWSHGTIQGCTVHKDLQRLQKKHQPNTNSRVITANSDSPQIQSSSQLMQGETQHYNNVLLTPQNKPKDTQHILFSQAVKGIKSNKLVLNNTNGSLPNQLLTSQLSTFISEFKTLISPLITLLNP